MLRIVGLLSISILIVCAKVGNAQNTTATDTTDTKSIARNDSIRAQELKRKLDYTAKRFNPRKALLFSAVFPGAGQVYNKKYWKVPLVFGAILLTALPVNFYNSKYTIYKNQLFAVINYPDPKLGAVVTQDNLLADAPQQLAISRFTKQQLEDLANNNRRNRDYFVILTGLVYLLQMVDAHVDAHLKEFKVNPNLQVKVEPRFEQNYFAGNTSGMALVLKF
jgi:hypothetical protein